MKFINCGLIVLLACSVLGQKQNPSLTVSAIALSAASAADAASSWHQPEANPLLGSQFGADSLAIKAGITASMLLAERPLIRHYPEIRKWFVIANWMTAGVFTGAAIHNWRTR